MGCDRVELPFQPYWMPQTSKLQLSAAQARPEGCCARIIHQQTAQNKTSFLQTTPGLPRILRGKACSHISQPACLPRQGPHTPFEPSSLDATVDRVGTTPQFSSRKGVTGNGLRRSRHCEYLLANKPSRVSRTSRDKGKLVSI